MLTLHDYLELQAARKPDKPAVVDEARSLSFAALRRASEHAANRLSANGIGAGMRVGLGVGDNYRFLVLLHAVSALGAVSVPVDWRMMPDDTARHLARFGVDHFLTERPKPGLAAVETTVIDEQWQDEAAASPARAPQAIDPDRPFMLVATSGTTGEPDGRLMTHSEWTARLMNFSASCRHETGGTLVVATPLSQAAGVMQSMLHLMIGNAVIVHSTLFTASALVEEVNRRRATHLLAVPSMIRMLLKDDFNEAPLFPHLKMLTVTGAALHEDEKRAVVRRLTPRLYEFYGTAASGFTTCLGGADIDARSGSVGRAMPLSIVEIVDDAGQTVPAGEVGRIRVRGPGVALTSARLANAPPRPGGETVEDRWYYTGDCGALDGEGFLYLRGRVADIVIRSGINVYPQEVEECLLRHPAILEAAVFGFESARSGEDVAAAVIAQAELSKEDVIAHCRFALASYKVPSQVLIVDEFPRTSSGKVRKTDLRQLLEEM